ncbi:hypothetical protein Poli38472_014179 [Pythium oligandrum]|uniref:FYVE-type domain-containing protein n=1 Tax=Pythium oligandrum TaxID=41045 RepID=A0A8K1CKR7_PYTOL|nr:hypothetical protein Poli38472_014179 [Pythium oligandrum]|eukprot:TMW64062.1 hypothetical protein Poli38472_014179 [Pythium oligandrum]
MKLNLSREEEDAIIHKVSARLDRTQAHESEFRTQGRAVNAKEWKLVNSREDFYIYKQRDELVAKEESRVPRILCAGTVEGKMEDFMLGIYDGDELAWRIRSAYMNDKFADTQFLSTIISPTREEPFRYMGVKWLSTQSPPVVGAFIRKRDHVVVEAMGTTKDGNGETFGYYMLEDYSHPSIPDHSDVGILRSKLSMCCIARQVTSDRIALYVRSRIDLDGDLPMRLAVSIASLSLASLANAVDTAYNKKLAWLISHQKPKRPRVNEGRPRAPSSMCHSCGKAPSGLLARSLAYCQVCRSACCAKCSVEKKLVVDLIAGQPTLRSMPFCFACVRLAKELDPIEVGRPPVPRDLRGKKREMEKMEMQ